jgi:hypothetical protein
MGIRQVEFDGDRQIGIKYCHSSPILFTFALEVAVTK